MFNRANTILAFITVLTPVIETLLFKLNNTELSTFTLFWSFFVWGLLAIFFLIGRLININEEQQSEFITISTLLLSPMCFFNAGLFVNTEMNNKAIACMFLFAGIYFLIKTYNRLQSQNNSAKSQ